MHNRAALLALAFGIAFLTMPAFAQTEETIATSAPAPVAYVYIQTTPGVMVYAAAANGTLTPVKGSPFKVIGQMEDIGGKFLISVGNTILHTYSIGSNGAVGKQIFQINTASYGGSECGTTSGQGSVLDHTGKYLYVHLHTINQCDAWQTYIVETNGSLKFLGDTALNSYDALANTISGSNVTVSSNDKFFEGVIPENPFSSDCEGLGENCPVLAGMTTSAYCRCSPSGVLGPSYAGDVMAQPPTAPTGWQYLVNLHSSTQADPFGNLAVLMNQYDGHGNASARPQLASFAIDPSTGLVSSSNAYYNMPNVVVGQKGNITPSMSPSGKLLAVVGYPGLQIFHFNADAPATTFGGLLLSGIDLDQAKWDSENHLFVLSYNGAKLYVYTVTPTSMKQAPGSPHTLPKSPYGTRGMVVVK
jgi:hypothetical protein